MSLTQVLMTDTISKRLHISGLTPQVTSEDLTKRLSSFGKVQALDGVGKLDALGRPRPFAYATLETSKGQLAKCELQLGEFLVQNGEAELSMP